MPSIGGCEIGSAKPKCSPSDPTPFSCANAIVSCTKRIRHRRSPPSPRERFPGLFAAFVGIGAKPSHRVNVGTTEPPSQCSGACGPTSPTASARPRIPIRNACGKLSSERCESPKRLQSFVGEADVDRESRAVLLLPRVDAIEHVAQPGARLRAVGEFHEDVTPIAHEDGRDHVVLDIVKVVLQVGGRQTPARNLVLMIALLPQQIARQPSSRPIARARWCTEAR